MYGRGGYPNRGGMRPQSWGPMSNAPMGSYGNQWSSNTNPAWGQQQQQQQQQQQPGMNYAGAVKNEQIKQEHMGQQQQRPAQQRPPLGKDQGPSKKKSKLEQMG